MTDEKRKALEAAGWRVGTVQELLNLSDQDVADIEDKLERDLGGIKDLVELNGHLETVEAYRDEEGTLMIVQDVVHDEAAVIAALAPQGYEDDPSGTGVERTEFDEALLATKLGMAMLDKLHQHRAKGHWSPRSMTYLRKRLLDEIGELFDAIDTGDSPEHVWSEAADVSNFVAMLADNYSKQVHDDEG